MFDYEPLRKIAQTEDVFDCSLIAARDHKIRIASPGCYRVFGHFVGDMESRDLVLILPKYIQKAHPNLINTFLDSGFERSKVPNVVNAVHADGHMVPILVLLERVEVTDGADGVEELVRARVIALDYPKLRQAMHDAGEMPQQMTADETQRTADAYVQIADVTKSYNSLSNSQRLWFLVPIFLFAMLASGFYLLHEWINRQDCSEQCRQERNEVWQDFRGQTLNQHNRPLPGAVTPGTSEEGDKRP